MLIFGFGEPLCTETLNTMITRIQSLYLFIAAVLAFGSMAVPFWRFTAGQTFFISDFSMVEGAGPIFTTSSIAGGIFSPLTGMVAFATIFIPSNRKLQKQLIMLCMALFAGDLLSGLIAAHFMNIYLSISADTLTHKPGAGLFMLLPEPVLFWMALNGVEKDEKTATAYKRL